MNHNVVTASRTGRSRNIFGIKHVWKLEADQSAGNLMCVHITIPSGRGIPPHRHEHEDETFYVMSGRVIFEGDGLDDGRVTLDPGGLFHGPRGWRHGFYCEGPQAAEVLVIVTPGNGMNAMFEALADLSDDRSESVDVIKVDEICSRFGVKTG